jgi:hypothetical protein
MDSRPIQEATMSLDRLGTLIFALLLALSLGAAAMLPV